LSKNKAKGPLEKGVRKNKNPVEQASYIQLL